MPIGSTSRRSGTRLGLALALILCSFGFVSRAVALPELEVRVQDTTVYANQQIPITISLTNRTDSVEAFTVWIKLNRPDIAHFHYTMVSGVARGMFDTIGTATRGFELLDVRSTIGNGLDMLITGIANANGGPPAYKAPIAPASQSKILIKLYLDVQNVPDSQTDRSGVFHIEKDFLDKFIFSRVNGTAIGVYSVVVPDTICYQCLQWVGQTCVNKVRISTPPCDLTEIVQDTIALLDTTKVKAFDGSLTLFAGCCQGTTGNVNGVGICDLADLSALVSYLTGAGYVLPCSKEANINAQGIVDLADLSALVSYLTGGGFSLPSCP
ncbi:MAG: hypothetical protein WAU88_04065 [Candidatus Zixiibacteriota bacterium]